MAQFTRQHLSDGRAEVADARTLEIGLPAVTGPISPYFHGCSMDKTIKNGGFHVVYKKTVPTLWGFLVGISKWIFMACQLEQQPL